jgi:hypothetical protein
MRVAGKHNSKKFCSDECRNIYGLTKKSTQVTKVCVGCGEEFTKPSWYPSKMMYCSNACAKKEQKFGWSKAGLAFDDGSVLIFRSLYEMRFAAACEHHSIPWRNYDGPDIQTSLGNYRPDFIATVAGKDIIVEVKGWMDDESAIKCFEAKLQFENFVVLDKDSLFIFERDGDLI